MFSRLTLIMWITAASVHAVCPAEAQKSIPMAKTHYASAVSYYRRGQYKEAIKEFKAAYRLSRKPALFFNIGQCWERLGKIQGAIRNFRRYLAAVPNAEDRVQVATRIRSLEARLASTSIAFNGGPPGAKVRVDGKTIGVLPLKTPVKVRPGQHRVEVRKTGLSPFRSVVVVPEGRTLRVRVIMTRLSAPSARPTPAGQKPTSRRRVWTWVTLGLGVAALAAGIGLGMAANDSAKKANRSLAEGAVDRYDDFRKDAKLRAGLADGLFALGGTAVVVSIVLFFVEPKKRPEKPTSWILPQIGPTGIGLTAGARF